MDRGINQHLSAAELAELMETVRQREPSMASAEDVHPHFAVCPTCREHFEEHLLLDRQLEKLKSSEPAPQQADCLELARWREIAAGVTPSEEALAHLHHASRCDHCGPLLRDALAEVTDLNIATTEAEQSQIANLASAQPEWQRHMAERMAGTFRVDPSSAPWWKAWTSVPRLAMAGAALAVLVAAASWIAVYWRDSNSPGFLLARAYTEHRTLEMRFGGAAYAPLRVQRGPEASFADRPSSLLKAEALIASQLPSHPSNPLWLQAKGRADLLEGKYDAAVESLRRALQLSPDSPELMVDLASAYFQRAQTEDRPLDYGAAFESLSKVLAKHPDDPVALFNRAIISEHQFLYHQALDDWEHYLLVDARSEWADEARKRADAVREKLKQHESANRPLLSPGEIAGSATPPADLDERVEQYLEAALQSWLPEAYPETNAAADPPAGKALFFLANLTSQQHSDRWLSDLLQGSSSPMFPQAVAALAHAIQANETGEYDASRRQAAFAVRLFRASGNQAGVLRAQFERIFALQIIRQSESCRRQASAVLTESEKYSYPWLHTQLGLEEGVCSGLMGDIGTYKKSTRRAMERAQKNGYGALSLRALGFAARNEFDAGEQAGAWRLAGAGLARYWSGPFPAMRGYNLYTELITVAEATSTMNLQVAMWREAVTLIDAEKDLRLRAMAHNSMANAATAAQQPQVAEQQYMEASRLYALGPRTEASLSNALENEIGAAQLEASLGRFDAAITRLTSVQDEARLLSNNYLVRMFYSTLGEVQLRRHRAAEAEQALRPALALAEQNLESLSSEAERMNWSKEAAPEYLALAEAELDQGRSQEALETYEWYLGVSQRVGTNRYPSRSLTNPPVPVPSGLASRLPFLSRETVLAYGLLPDGLAIWVYDDRGVNVQWIPKPTQDLQELAARFIDLSSDPRSELSALRRDARSLYASLIAPVEERLGPGRTLVIEATGWLAQVPFEALLDSTDHYLIERGAVVHSLGQESMARLREVGPISADLSALIVGSTASSTADGLIPLPDVAAEADTVANGFHSARVLKGRQATFNAVRNELPAAAVFHFAGHSLSAPDNAGLMLVDGDAHSETPPLLDADALRRVKLSNLQLAVLSACSTAAGGGGSSGFNSITQTLLRAGVPHVVASRWAVDSVQARAFVDDFYRHALSGRPVSDAMRLTSREMLSNPRSVHPYYWSAFAVYGRP